MEIVSLETSHVAGRLSGAGDPSPFTARGVFRAMQASAKYLWNVEDLSGVTVAIQGCGQVGYYLAKNLHAAGVKLIVSDVDAKKVSRVVEDFSAEGVEPDDIVGQSADIFAPCALGKVINDQTIPLLRAQIVVGAANNQLSEDRHGEMLKAKGILYIPDYAANSGGVFSGCTELLGWKSDEAMKRVDDIYDTILRILEIAKAEDISTNKAADRIAESRLRAVSS
jgi:leucine dehydrogenase